MGWDGRGGDGWYWYGSCRRDASRGIRPLQQDQTNPALLIATRGGRFEKIARAAANKAVWVQPCKSQPSSLLTMAISLMTATSSACCSPAHLTKMTHRN